MPEIIFITTGGTIDKIYFDDRSAYEVGEPQLGEVLKEANCTFSFQVVPLMRKDSLDMTEGDRRLIRKTIEAHPGRRFVVTHGTDTMIETGLALKQIPGKVIVLTGAMQPARFRQTDAVFNIAGAVFAVQLLPEGIYIAMNGRILDPAKARKNHRRHCFESL